jgi:integrase
MMLSPQSRDASGEVASSRAIARARLTSGHHPRRVLQFDPLLDKTYRSARLGRDVVDWLAWLELGEAASRTLDQYERDLARLCKLFPTKAIDEITDGDLLQLAKRFRPAERRVRIAAVRSFFKWAKQTRRITDNPCDYLPDIRPPKPRVPDVFTDVEVEQLYSLDVVDAAPLGILLDGGLRKDEACQLQLRHIRNGQIVVNGKGAKQRAIPVVPRLANLLLDLEILEGLNPQDHLFYGVHANSISSRRIRQTMSGRIGYGTFARWWKRCLDEAGVRYRNPHVARHTFATRWRQRGLGLDEIQLLLGHASIATTVDIYTHTRMEEVARHMQQILTAEAEEL